MADSTTTSHIAIDAGICGGRPHIVGHRIRVQDIVIAHEALGRSPDEIVSDFPDISLSDVYAALAYYHDHRDEIRAAVAADDATAQDLHKISRSKLLDKLMSPDG